MALYDTLFKLFGQPIKSKKPLLQSGQFVVVYTTIDKETINKAIRRLSNDHITRTPQLG